MNGRYRNVFKIRLLEELRALALGFFFIYAEAKRDFNDGKKSSTL